MLPDGFYNIAASVSDACAAAPESILFIAPDETNLSRKEFLALVAARQKQLNGITVGTRVLTASQRGIAFFVDLVALWGIGAIPVPYDGKASSEELGAFRDLVEAQKVLSDGTPTTAGDSDLQFASAMENQIAAILITSGSSGKPKGCMLTHRAIAGNAFAAVEALEYGPKDRLLINIPFHFTSAICHFLAVALSGGTLIGSEDRLLPGDFLNRLAKMEANVFAGAPLQLRWVANAGSGKLPLLRRLLSSGDHLPVEVITLLRKMMPGTKIYTIYGLTELGGRFCTLHPNLIDKFAGSVGKPIAGLTYTVRGGDEHVCEAGETGEIFVQGEYCFTGYCNNPAETAKTITPHGVKTGDLGYISPEGMLYVVGRNDDVFKVNGLKVSSIVIEQELMKSGWFDDVAVIPKETAMLGIVPIACYVLKAGNTFNQSATTKWLSASLPSNHLPASFIKCEAIPRTQSGKIKRRVLIETISKRG